MRIKVVKKLRYFSLVAIVVLIGIVSAACGTKKNVNSGSSGTTYKGMTVYPTKINSVKTSNINDGYVLVTGTTDAPNGAKVLLQTTNSDFKQMSFSSSYNNGYAKVKNHKFKLYIFKTLFILQKDDVIKNKNIKVNIFAVTGYHEKFKKYKITNNLSKAVAKAKLKPYKLKSDKNIVDFIDKVDAANSGKVNSADINDVVDQWNETFQGDAKFGYDSKKKTFTFAMTKEDGRAKLNAIKSGAEDASSWSELTSVIDDISEDIYDYSNLHLPISIIDPENNNKILYTSLDGLETYDFMRQK